MKFSPHPILSDVKNKCHEHNKTQKLSDTLQKIKKGSK